MCQLSNHDVPKILSLLESVSGVTLPNRGFLAGQAVCSAILYLKGIRKDIYINDLDVFHVVPEITERKGLIKHNQYTKAGAVSLSAYSADSYIHAGAKTQYDQCISNAIENLSYHDEQSGYEGIILGAKDKYIRSQNILRVNNYASFCNFERQGYTIYDVFRNGLINSVIVKARNLSYNSIINEFDINATMVGICLETGQIYYTYEFLDYLSTKELKVTNSARPYHTLVRLIKKSDELKMPFNEELSLDILNTVIHLGDKKVFEDMVGREKEKCGNLLNSQYSGNDSLKLNLMGKVYKEKIEGINNFPSEYSLNNIQVANRIRTKNGSVVVAEDKYDLYSFKTSMDMPKYIDSGKHLELIEKRTNSIVLGYPTLLKYLSAQILTAHHKNDKKIKVFVTEDIRPLDAHPYGIDVSKAIISNEEMPILDWDKALTEKQYQSLNHNEAVRRLIYTTPVELHALVLRYAKILDSKKYEKLRLAGHQNPTLIGREHAKFDLSLIEPNRVTYGIEKHLEKVIESAKLIKIRSSVELPILTHNGYEIAEMNSSYSLIENRMLSGRGRTPIYYSHTDIAKGMTFLVQVKKAGRYIGCFKLRFMDASYNADNKASILLKQKKFHMTSSFSKDAGYGSELMTKLSKKYMEKMSDMGIIHSLINEYHKPKKLNEAKENI